MARVFISYSRKDTDFVRRLYAALKERALECWVDWEGIPPADDWLRKIHASIEGVDAFVFVMSPDSLDSRVCADEIAHAGLHNKRLIPVVLRESLPGAEAASDAPASLRRLNWIFLRATDDFTAGIEKLAAAIHTDLDWVGSHTRLLERAIEWQASAHDDSFLLQKNDLTAAEQWLTRGPDKDPKPTALQSDFIIASRAAATRRQRRLTAAAVAAAVLIGIGAVVATVQYVIAEIRREEGLSRQLAAQSASTLDDAPALGLLLAVHAHDIAPTAEAAAALLAALERVRGVRAFLPGAHLPGTLALSADGVLMAVGRCIDGADPECRRAAIDLWRTTDMQRMATAEVEPPVWQLAFADDAKRLAATLCCSDVSDSPQVRALTFKLGGDAAGADGRTLTPDSDLAYEWAHAPSPARALADLRAVEASDRALERVRRAAGAGSLAFSASPASYGAVPRVVATIGGADLLAPTRVELWDAAASPRRLARGTLRSFFSGEAAIRADGRLAAAYGCTLAASGRICDEGELVIIDDTGERPLVATLRRNQLDWIRSLAFVPDAPLVLTGGCGDYSYQNCRAGELRLWRAQFDGEEPLGHEPVRTFGGAVESIALSADGRTIGLTSQRGKVALLRFDAARAAAAAWLASPLLARLGAADGGAPPAFDCGGERVRNPDLARAGARLQAPGELCGALALIVPGINQTMIDERVLTAASATGDRLALAGCMARQRDGGRCEQERTTVWSVVDRRLALLATLDTAFEATTLAFAPDGHSLALGSCGDGDCAGGRLELVDLGAAGAPRRPLAEGMPPPTALAFRPAGDGLAYAYCARRQDTGAVRGCGLGAIRLLRLAGPPPTEAPLTGHGDDIDSLAFSPDGTLLVSGAADGSVGLWEPLRGMRLGPTVVAHDQPVRAIRFESADAFLSSTADDAAEWHASPARWTAIACRIANRPLSAAEHAHFLGAQEAARDPCAAGGAAPRSGMWRWLRVAIGAR